MELGAMVCVPSHPLCSRCPVEETLRSRRLGIQDEIPAARTRRAAQQTPVVILILAAKAPHSSDFSPATCHRPRPMGASLQPGSARGILKRSRRGPVPQDVRPHAPAVTVRQVQPQHHASSDYGVRIFLEWEFSIGAAEQGERISLGESFAMRQAADFFSVPQSPYAAHNGRRRATTISHRPGRLADGSRRYCLAPLRHVAIIAKGRTEPPSTA